MKQHVIQLDEGNTVVGMLSGFVGGFTTYLLQLHSSYWMNLLQAGITALICGIGGVAGKEFYLFVKRYIKKKNEKTVRQNRKG